MVKNYIVIVFCFLFILCAHAQDLDKDMKYFYTGFMFLPSLECEMESKAYKRSDNSYFFNQRVKLIIHNNQFYYDMGDMLYISNKQYLMWLDKKQKRMIVGRTSVNEVADFRRKLIGQSDSMSFKSNGEVIFDGLINGLKTYRIVNLKNELIKQVNITFEAATGYLRKMEVIMADTRENTVSSSSTEFMNINIKPKVDESIFNLDGYFIVKETKILPTAAYKNYELITIDPKLLDYLKN